jgi:hypothetical protein
VQEKVVTRNRPCGGFFFISVGFREVLEQLTKKKREECLSMTIETCKKTDGGELIAVSVPSSCPLVPGAKCHFPSELFSVLSTLMEKAGGERMCKNCVAIGRQEIPVVAFARGQKTEQRAAIANISCSSEGRNLIINGSLNEVVARHALPDGRMQIFIAQEDLKAAIRSCCGS